MPPREPLTSDTRVLVLFDPLRGWARELLRGVNEIALERGWALLLYSPLRDLRWLLDEWAPSAVVVGPSLPPARLGEFGDRLVVGANADLSAEHLAWVGADEDAVGELAAAHLLSKGLREFATFSFEADGWAGRRRERFRARIAEAGGRCHADGWLDTAQPTRAR